METDRSPLCVFPLSGFNCIKFDLYHCGLINIVPFEVRFSFIACDAALNSNYKQPLAKPMINLLSSKLLISTLRN